MNLKFIFEKTYIMEIVPLLLQLLATPQRGKGGSQVMEEAPFINAQVKKLVEECWTLFSELYGEKCIFSNVCLFGKISWPTKLNQNQSHHNYLTIF